jgi:polysaccharide pyruvyl transferase WcaK-like protein
VKTAFTLADRVTVRDDFSKHVLATSGVDKEASLEEDLAFKLEPSSRERSLQILSKHCVNIGKQAVGGSEPAHPASKGQVEARQYNIRISRLVNNA